MSSLIPILFKNELFSSKIFEDFLDIFMILSSNLISLWLENILLF